MEEGKWRSTWEILRNAVKGELVVCIEVNVATKMVKVFQIYFMKMFLHLAQEMLGRGLKGLDGAGKVFKLNFDLATVYKSDGKQLWFARIPSFRMYVGQDKMIDDHLCIKRGLSTFK